MGRGGVGGGASASAAGSGTGFVGPGSRGRDALGFAGEQASGTANKAQLKETQLKETQCHRPDLLLRTRGTDVSNQCLHFMNFPIPRTAGRDLGGMVPHVG